MKNISLKLQQSLLEDTEEILKELHLSRNRYINEAVEFYNKVQRRKMIEARVVKVSELVRKDSMEVLKEFERLEDEGRLFEIWLADLNPRFDTFTAYQAIP